MATQVPGKSIRTLSQGTRVFRAAATLPASTNQTLFTVTGRIIVTTLLGEVTTAIQAQANATIVRSLGTAGATTTPLHLGWDVNGLTLGTLASIGGPGVAVSATAGAGAVIQANEFIVPAGTIQLNTAATSTGAIAWTLVYIALDDGASVVVA